MTTKPRGTLRLAERAADGGTYQASDGSLWLLTPQCPPVPHWEQIQVAYQHDAYDGAPDAGDSRHGACESYAASAEEIEEHIETGYWL